MSSPSAHCNRCRKPLTSQFIRAGQLRYHPACFICEACRQPLDKQFHTKGDRLYHPACYEKYFIPRCSHCREPMIGPYVKAEQGRFHPACYEETQGLYCCRCGAVIQGSYIFDLWGNKAHPQHQGQATPQCHICARLIGEKTSQGCVDLGDGRVTCGFCQASVPQDFQAMHQAKLDVIRQMHAVGFDYIPDYIRIQIAEDQTLLNQRLQASPTGNIHGYTRTAQRHIPQYGLILEHRIFVISGLPRVAFMGVVAHELLHVWINENQLQHLSPPQVEGFCNLATALIYDNDGSELAKVLLRRMEEDPDPVYGDGYRAMKQNLAQWGWPKLIAALKSPGALPAVQTPSRTSQPVAPPKKSIPPATPTPNPDAAQHLAEIKARLQAQIKGKDPEPPAAGGKLQKLNRPKKK